MQIDTPNLFVEINNTNYIFIVGKYNENQKLEIVEKLITPSDGIYENKFTNIYEVSEIIKKNVEVIEKKLNFIFKDLILIIDNFDYSCVNISGFKKLNGSQVLKENISYILNSLKLAITENEKEKTILHIFNSKSVLDGTTIEKLPIGLFGDFYNHELTFFLIKNNDLKNIKQIFNKINLNVKKIFLKSFSEGVQLINQEKNTETFFKIKLSKNESHISFFENAAFRYSEHFNFGTDIIFKDIEKICSINNEIIKNILSNIFFGNKSYDDKEFVEEKYFPKTGYKKIRKKLIQDIVNARIDEIIDIIMNKNINIQYFKKNNLKVYVIIQDKIISDNFKETFKSCFLRNVNADFNLINEFEIESIIKNTAKLSIYGWNKEAIPISQTKNSIITRIFKFIFG